MKSAEFCFGLVKSYMRFYMRLKWCSFWGALKPDTRNDIFQYGSLIGKKDLLARQIFLCLLILLDEQEQMIRK